MAIHVTDRNSATTKAVNCRHLVVSCRHQNFNRDPSQASCERFASRPCSVANGSGRRIVNRPQIDNPPHLEELVLLNATPNSQRPVAVSCGADEGLPRPERLRRNESRSLLMWHLTTAPQFWIMMFIWSAALYRLDKPEHSAEEGAGRRNSCGDCRARRWEANAGISEQENSRRIHLPRSAENGHTSTAFCGFKLERLIGSGNLEVSSGANVFVYRCDYSSRSFCFYSPSIEGEGVVEEVFARGQARLFH
jgi:hypothetical protein